MRQQQRHVALPGYLRNLAPVGKDRLAPEEQDHSQRDQLPVSAGPAAWPRPFIALARHPTLAGRMYDSFLSAPKSAPWHTKDAEKPVLVCVLLLCPIVVQANR